MLSRTSLATNTDASNETAADSQTKSPSFLARPILRVGNITVAEFRAKFADQAQPIIFQGTTGDIFDPAQWTRDNIKEHCGDRRLVYSDDDYCKTHEGITENQGQACHQVDYVTEDLVGEEWAALKPADLWEFDIHTLRDLMEIQDTPAGSHLQLFGATLNHYCPPAMKWVRWPKYFDRDYLQFDKSSFRDPFFFISKKGSGSRLHADDTIERVWVQALSGRKHWRLFPPTEYWRLYPNLSRLENSQMTENDFGYYPQNFYADAMNPDFEKFPLLDGALMYEGVLEPGEVLFLPEGWAHQVVNLDDTISVVRNFMDWGGARARADYMRYTTENLQEDDHPDLLLYNAFFLPLDRIQRASPEENIDLDLFYDSHDFKKEPVPEKVKKWVSERSEEEIDNYRGYRGFPALTLATYFNFTSVVKYLVEVGEADVNVKDAHGETPLDWARDEELYAYLEEHGALDELDLLDETCSDLRIEQFQEILEHRGLECKGCETEEQFFMRVQETNRFDSSPL